MQLGNTLLAGSGFLATTRRLEATVSQNNSSDDVVERILKELETMPMGLSARDRRVVRAVLAGNLKMTTIAKQEGISPRSLSRIVKRLGLKHLRARASKRELLKLFRDAVREKDAADAAAEADAREGIKVDEDGKRYTEIEIIGPDGIWSGPFGVVPDDPKSNVREVRGADGSLFLRRYLPERAPEATGTSLEGIKPLPSLVDDYPSGENDSE